MTVILKWNHLTGACYEPGNEPVREQGVQIIRDIDGYVSPVSQEWIGSRAARREDLKRNDCREVDPSENKWWAKERASKEQQRERNIDRAVNETFQRLRNG